MPSAPAGVFSAKGAMVTWTREAATSAVVPMPARVETWSRRASMVMAPEFSQFWLTVTITRRSDSRPSSTSICSLVIFKA